MIRRSVFLSIFLLFILATAPASAVEEISREGIQTFDIEAPEGYSLSAMEVYNLPANSNNTFIFDAYGKTYTLQANSSKSWGWWTFDLSLQLPNGTIQTTQLDTLAPAATDWDLHVQYYFLNADSSFDLDVYAALLPLSASFGTATNSGILQFSSVSGSSTDPFNLKLYATTDEEFQQQSELDLGLQLSTALGEVFGWTWNAVLSFVGLIPYVGDDLVTAILIASYIIDEIFFYFNLLFVEYLETTILSIEFFMVTYSMVRTKSKNPVKMVKNIVSDQAALFEKIIDITRLAIDLLISIIRTIATIVQSLKPT